VPFCCGAFTSQIHLQKGYLSVVISFLRRWFGASLPERHETFTLSEKKVLLAGITAEKDDDLEWFWPPSTIADVAAWDRYWNDQISHGLTPPLFDLLNNGSHLAAVMNGLGMRSLLCVGNGISQEPRAFAEAGFNVTALDPCAEAVRFAQSWNFSPKDYEFNMEPLPRCHGGQVQFVLGDILDPGICPGPFDVVVERRMLQLFEPERRPIVLAALASRMNENAILLSHAHYGHWRPDEDCTHPLRSLLLETGWQLWSPHHGPKPLGRVAWLYFTTG